MSKILPERIAKPHDCGKARFASAFVDEVLSKHQPKPLPSSHGESVDAGLTVLVD